MAPDAHVTSRPYEFYLSFNSALLVADAKRGHFKFHGRMRCLRKAQPQKPCRSPQTLACSLSSLVALCNRFTYISWYNGIMTTVEGPNSSRPNTWFCFPSTPLSTFHRVADEPQRSHLPPMSNCLLSINSFLFFPFFSMPFKRLAPTT